MRPGAFISAAATIAPSALGHLHTTHPGVHLVLREMERSQTYAALLRGDLDLAITFDYAHAPTAAPPGVREEHLVEDPIMVVSATSSNPTRTTLVMRSSSRVRTSARHSASSLPTTGVALLPSLALHHAALGAVARRMAGGALVRPLFTARLATTKVPIPSARSRPASTTWPPSSPSRAPAGKAR